MRDSVKITGDLNLFVKRDELTAYIDRHYPDISKPSVADAGSPATAENPVKVAFDALSTKQWCEADSNWCYVDSHGAHHTLYHLRLMAWAKHAVNDGGSLDHIPNLPTWDSFRGKAKSSKSRSGGQGDSVIAESIASTNALLASLAAGQFASAHPSAAPSTSPAIAGPCPRTPNRKQTFDNITTSFTPSRLRNVLEAANVLHLEGLLKGESIGIFALSSFQDNGAVFKLLRGQGNMKLGEIETLKHLASAMIESYEQAVSKRHRTEW
ncbi:hypothetical protein P7C70_g9339, partial [Phenoliferia sp. Uapishka_3]